MYLCVCVCVCVCVCAAYLSALCASGMECVQRLLGNGHYFCVGPYLLRTKAMDAQSGVQHALLQRRCQTHQSALCGSICKHEAGSADASHMSELHRDGAPNQRRAQPANRRELLLGVAALVHEREMEAPAQIVRHPREGPCHCDGLSGGLLELFFTW